LMMQCFWLTNTHNAVRDLSKVGLFLSIILHQLLQDVMSLNSTGRRKSTGPASKRFPVHTASPSNG
jgi:hypothetical protein